MRFSHVRTKLNDNFTQKKAIDKNLFNLIKYIISLSEYEKTS